MSAPEQSLIRKMVISLCFRIGIFGILLHPVIAPAQDKLVLLMALPKNNHQMQDCDATRRATLTPWRRYSLRANLRWQDSAAMVNQTDAFPNAGKRFSDLRGHCFKLMLNNLPVVQGAIVSLTHSPTLMFPVLVLNNYPDAPVHEFLLLPTLSRLEHVPEEWERRLSQEFTEPVPPAIGQDGAYK